MHKRSLSILEAFITFAVAGCWFFALVVFLLPKLQCIPRINSAVTWFITGYLVFIPLLLYAIVRVVNEGNRGFSDILSSLAFKPMTKKDWLYALIGTVVAFAGTGLVYGLSIVATRVIGIRAISPSPWFMTIEPFYGYTRLLLLVWFPMFLCNIFGEEIVWRGYIQNRMPHQYSWIVNGSSGSTMIPSLERWYKLSWRHAHHLA